MTIEEIKKIVIPACKMFNVARLSVFGSCARGNMNESSDIDFIVEFKNPENKLSKRYFALLHFFEDSFHCGIDMLMPDGIKNAYFRKIVMEEKIDIYEK
ncbi:nucleotidyltransferase domain-containing protein [bacterium]|nr:nucleotidyltransferase domain-containing protein [bacterium]